MNELDEIWTRRLNDAINQAKTEGSGDVADYLALKAGNDAVRQTAVKWLFDALLEIAAHANRNGSKITVENENPHRFPFGNSSLVGALLRFRQGVRCLTIEAGWTRAPADGFMRGGALACARITHFGFNKHNAELFLINSNNTVNWISPDKNGGREIFDSRHLQNHFRIFAGD